MAVRGRVQVEWRSSSQTRANSQRDWLNGQLTGRGYVAEDIPRAQLKRAVWVTVCDAAFDTVQEGDTVRTLCLSRMSADPLIVAGSWVKVHTCPHDDATNTCASTLVTTVK